jgi:RNA polymerase-binding transcription factor DksA
MERNQLRRLLNAKKKELTRLLENIHNDVFNLHNDNDTRHRATQRKKLSALYTLEQSAILELDRINRALLRLNNETFDACSECGKTIADKQLKAIPYSEYCAECEKLYALRTIVHPTTH